MSMHLLSSLMITGWLAAAPSPATSAPVGELWAGHQIGFGSREIPFKGTVTTRSDSFVLAEVRRTEGRIELVQRACRVLIEPVGGVRVTVDAAAMPHASMRFVLGEHAKSLVADAVLAWDEDDIDDDGKPGMTVTVDAPVCSGELYVTNRSTTHAAGMLDGRRFDGHAWVRVVQHVIDTKGACLSMAARDTDERVQGPFAYVPVPAGSTCEGLLRNGWPVDAESE
jgi:hypothetical protein